jgi:hypothetical protein
MFKRFLKIYYRLETPQITIPCLGGLNCQIVVVEQYNQTREIGNNRSIFGMRIESKKNKAKLAGSVEINCNGEGLSGDFGDETKEEFTAWGRDIMGWEFQTKGTLTLQRTNQ